MNKFTITFLLTLLYLAQAKSQTININGPAGSGAFGKTITVLTNGNYVVSDPTYSEGGLSNIGAVYLYDGSSHALISVLKGDKQSDFVGAYITPLNNGNYVVCSPSWSNGAGLSVGAVTWCNGTTGLSGVVSAGNSLVGGTNNDDIGWSPITRNGVYALSNGNYVVCSFFWDNGSAADVGAVTWGNGTTGITGVVSSSNSLVGSKTNDNVGYHPPTILPNGNYVVCSYSWDNGSATDAGAVTWGNGATGITGPISSANSLVGSKTNDRIGVDLSGKPAIVILSNGNYVISSYAWDNGSATDAGAVTWANGATGITGVLSAANSLVGTTANDEVGYSGVIALDNGNYIVRSIYWNNGSATDAGAVTWGNGNTGITGPVSSSNSLVGSSVMDFVGQYAIALNNGNYVVVSPYWDNGAAIHAGAVTWGNGTTGIAGPVSSSNSLVGSTTLDYVGRYGVVGLSNGNYVVVSSAWNNGAATAAGAVTWGNGTTGTTGIVSTGNSLVGNATDDSIGIMGITTLSNGNYITHSPKWNNGAIQDAGAVTWGDGTSGTTGVVNSSNSLVGSTANDKVGDKPAIALNNGNYVVRNPYWDNGAVQDVGAVTWSDGALGISGPINSSNSLVGSKLRDSIGNGGLVALNNGNYVVTSQRWDDGAIQDAGAVTWSSGTTGVTGMISISNSLIGSAINDRVGDGGVTALTNGNYVVSSLRWRNSEIAVNNAGAVTWGNGTAGITGNISSNNSLVGSKANDSIGNAGITALSNGDYVVHSSRWDNGSTLNAGAITLGDGSTGVAGIITPCNSVVGGAANQGGSMIFTYNFTYDDLLTGRPSENIVSIFKPGTEALANTLDEVSVNITGTGTTHFIVNSVCRVIASLTPGGVAPVNGSVNAKAWIESSVPAVSGKPYIARHFEITPATNASAATGRVTLYCTQQEFNDFNAHAASTIDLPTGPADAAGIANLRIGKYSGTSNDGTGLPASYAGTGIVINPADADIIWNSSFSRWEISFDVTGFSGFIITTSNFTLPLTLLNFSGTLNGNDALLSWKTANETNTYSFDVERGTDGRSFIKAGTVAAANSPGDHYYTYTDADAAVNTGTLYYRLRQIDIDGKFTYSSIIRLSSTGTSNITIYPNPASNTVTLHTSNSSLLGTAAVLTDLQGKQVKQVVISNHHVQINVSNLSSGIYLLKLTDGTAIKLHKN